jgi:gliding motility-associated lipoprotein GldD
MKGLKKLNVMVFAAFLLMAAGCRDVAVPKPKGHFRIDLPEKKYVRLRDQLEKPGMPFSFEFPEYGILSFEKERADEGWFNIEFPRYRAKIYLTYKEINNNFASLMEQTYRMNVRNHMAKADAINEQAFNNEGDRVFGILYDLKGNTATAVQFYATDSVKHYLRGSLYFSAESDADSLAPVIDFFRKDIIHLIETLEWGM